MKNKIFSTLFLCLCLLTPTTFKGQSNKTPVLKAEQLAVIDSIANLIKSSYVFPEVANKIVKALQSNYTNGIYANSTDPILFSERLTTDLQSASKDKHFRVQYNPDEIKEIKASNGQPSGDEAIPASLLEQWKMNNYGFKEIKILEGNIAFIDLRNFIDTKFAGETAVAAMNFIGNANALIIDLRKNGGGSPDMVQLITSYFFEPEPIQLNSFYDRPSDKTQQTWTLPYVPGKRRPDIDIYILTSKRTFSAAEEFAYNLKNLNRATIVGEATGGGANTGEIKIINDRFTIFVPTGTSINPITKTNWEGTGVQPDIEVVAADALITAQSKALEKLAFKNANEPHNKYQWLFTSLKAKQHPIILNEDQLKLYTGAFGLKVITYENGNLLYPITPNRKAILIPIGKDLFDVEDNFLRVRFIRDGIKLSGITLENVNGTIERFDKI